LFDNPYFDETYFDDSAVALYLSFRDTVAVTDAHVSAVDWIRAHGDTVAIADAISKEPGKILAEAALAIADTLDKKDIGLGEADTLAIADSHASVVEFVRAEADTLAIADAPALTFDKILADTLAMRESVGGWAKSLTITIDHTEVDDTLTDFAAMIYLSASSGRTSADVSCVFDELQSDANRKKIAVKVNGAECYVEIKQWDDANEKAWLHVKVPSASSSVDTVLTLFYDRSHADNDTYVGDTNSTPAENVWDEHYKAVYHMADGVDNAHIYDSTSNNNDGTKKGANEPNQVAGMVGYAQDFDSGDDKITLTSPIVLADDTEWTVEILCNPNAQGAGLGLYGNGNAPGLYTRSFYHYAPDLQVRNDANDTVDWAFSYPTIYHHLAIICDGTNVDNLDLLVNGASQGLRTLADSSQTIAILGNTLGGVSAFDGPIGGFRISSIVRPPAHAKATKESLWDNLVTFGSEELLGAAKNVGVNKADTLALADTLDKKDIGIAEADTLTISDAHAVVVGFVRAYADTLAISDTLDKKDLGIAKADTFALADTLDSKDVGVAEADTLAIADAISKEPGKILADTLAITDAISKEPGLGESDTLGIADTFSRTVDWVRAYADTMAIADALAKSIGKPEADTLAIADALSKAIGIIEVETMAIADALVKEVGLGQSDTLAISDTLDKKDIGKALADAIAIVDSIVITGSYARPGIPVAAYLLQRAINTYLFQRSINAKSRREF